MIIRLENRERTNLEDLKDFETIADLTETLDNGQATESLASAPLQAEIEELKTFKQLAESIGEALLAILEKAFTRVEELGGQRKAVIFTESCRTQQYLQNILTSSGYEDQIALLNGSNNDEVSRQIYKNWCNRHANSPKSSGSKTADMKTAIVEEFRERIGWRGH